MMMRFLVLSTVLLLGGWASASAQPSPTTAEAPLSERRVSYTMDVLLDPEARTVQGTERVTWRNPGNVPVAELQFHLYLNAFKNERSTFMRESGGRHRGFSAEGDDVWGGVTVDRMQIAGLEGADLTQTIQFIHPDDDNPDDETVISVQLPQPVLPGETIALDIDFTSRLPKISARTGWEEKADGTPFFMVAQWFPKLGVYEVPGQRYVPEDAPEGQWSTHQFHANSEFYADFGTYDVTMTVPEDYVLGASGVRVEERTEGGMKTVRYVADDVHDFAWTASPAFEEYTTTWRHVNLRLLVQPEHADQAQRHFDAAIAALEHFDAWVGPYPYTTLTLVDGVGGSNGMEYPTLITCGTVYKLPAWARYLELVTIHEFGHQYFYGLLASNEAEEAWLDEGMNSYFEARIMDAAYGPGSVLDMPGFSISNTAMQRAGYTEGDPTRGQVYARAWDYPFGGYAMNSYNKPAVLLLTLENHLGWETMQAIWQTYYQRWRFRHPTTRDFIAVAEEVSGQDLGWFFDQFVYGTAVVDYRVDAITNRNVSAEGEETERYESTVRVERAGDAIFPQTLQVRFADGTTETRTWNGRDPWYDFAFTGEQRIVEAYLDPENHILLDIDKLNNRRVVGNEADRRVGRKYQLKTAVWLQQLFTLIAGLL